MITDSIVQDVRDARASIAADFGYDLSKYLVWIREQTKRRKEALANAGLNKTPDATGRAAAPSPAARKRRVRPASVSA